VSNLTPIQQFVSYIMARTR